MLNCHAWLDFLASSNEPSRSRDRREDRLRLPPPPPPLLAAEVVKWSDDQLEKERRRSANSEKAEEGIEGEEGEREKRTWCYNFSASFFAKFFSPRRRGGDSQGRTDWKRIKGGRR